MANLDQAFTKLFTDAIKFDPDRFQERTDMTFAEWLTNRGVTPPPERPTVPG